MQQMKYAILAGCLFLSLVSGCFRGNLCPDRQKQNISVSSYQCCKLPENIQLSISSQEFREIDEWVKKKGWKLSLDTYVYYGVVVKSDRYDLLINENVVLMNSHRFPFPQYVCSPDEKILEIAGQLESQK
ncbi:MAG: hypothetical protein J6J31_12785 [Thermoguttaceae bacterium]|nr:hypothetical protein [Thermoguttaceae bacterium]